MFVMRQLELFTRSQLAAIRDRTRKRNYSPEKEEFRRDHQRHRRWGLARRHAQKRCRSHGCSQECATVGLHEHSEPIPPLIWPDQATRLRQPAPPAPPRDIPAQRHLPPGRELPTDPASPTERATSARPPETATPTTPTPGPQPQRTADPYPGPRPQRTADPYPG